MVRRTVRASEADKASDAGKAGSGPFSSHDALTREFGVLQRLAGVDGVPRVDRLDPVLGELVIEEPDGIDIATAALAGRLEWPDFLALAARFARLLAAVHDAGVVHRHIAPRNLRVATRDLRAGLVGFDRASFLGAETAAESCGEVDDLCHAHATGDLAFLSPEQTGRMNRPVDARSDLYAFGAALYLLATGEPPFDDRDPLAVVHAHLARLPRPPHEIRAAVPPLLAAVLMRLLHKEPDARYQSATTLARDLSLLAENRLSQHEIGREDSRGDGTRPRPSRLFGMSVAQALVRDRCEQAAAGAAGILWICGPSGVGKTALAVQAAAWIADAGGWFATGRIDPMQRHSPFGAPLQALDQLCGTLLAGSAEAIAEAALRIRRAVQPHGAVLTALSSPLRALIGEQPAVPSAFPQDSQNRLVAALHALLGAVLRPGRPLVMFLDDLQWADLATIAFLESLGSLDDLPGLLVIGAWRDDDVPPEHPLQRMVDRLAQRNGAVRQLTLAPLPLPDLSLLVADMLSRPFDQVTELSGRLHAETGGNPHHAIELIESLQANGVFPMATQETSTAGAPSILGLPDLLARRLGELEAASKPPLSWAATLGHEFDLGSLRLVVDASEAELRLALGRLTEAGILMPSRHERGLGWRFTSSQMRQAAYDTITPADRAAAHLRCARRLSAGAMPQHAMAVARHYAEAILLVADPSAAHEDERATAARHFAQAATVAIGTADMESARHFIELARRLRPPDAWADAFDTTFALDVDWHAVLHALDRHDEADAVFAQLQQRATEPLQMVGATCVQVLSLSGRRRFEPAVRLGATLLQRLGLEVPSDDDARAAAFDELDRFDAMARALPLEALADLPDADHRTAETARLASHLAVAAFFHRPELAFWLVLRCSRLWAEHGFAEAMITPLAGVMVATIGLRGDYAGGWRAAQVALHASRTRSTGPAASRIFNVHGLVASHWFEPLEHSIPYARVAFEQMVKSGDLETACHASFVCQAASLEVATHIDLAEKEVAAGLRLAARIGHRHAADSFLTFQQFVRALRGQTHGFGSFDDESFDESLRETQAPDDRCAAAVFHIYRAWSACLFSDTLCAGHHVRALAPLLPFVTGCYPTVLACVATCLVLIDEAPCRPWSATGPLVEQIAWLEQRAADMPANFQHLLDLVEARRAAAEGRHWEAACRFDLAMRRSSAARRTLHHALTVELAGRFHLQHGLRSTGQHLLRKALASWQRWGAHGKVVQLRQRFAFLVVGESAPGAGPQASIGWRGEIDRLAILRASQALSSETDLDRLVPQVVQVIAQLSGATSVCLLFKDDLAAGWSIVGGMRDGTPLQGLPRPAADAAELGLSRNVVRHAVRGEQPEVIDDVANDERFMHDSAFNGALAGAAGGGETCVVVGDAAGAVAGAQASAGAGAGAGVSGGAGAPSGSMLWIPVHSKGVVNAHLVLENRLATRFFTAEHLELLRVITAQLSISIENALLYRSLEQRVSERTRALAVRGERLNAVFELSPDGFVLLDSDDRVSIVNPAFERMTGLATDSLLGLDRCAFEQRLVDLCGGVPAQAAVPPQFAETQSPWPVEALDGSVYTAADRVARQSLLHLKKPHPRTLLRRVRRGEATSAADAGSLGRPETVMFFRDMTRELEIDQMKSSFLSTAAHELRTPMTSIYGFAELLIKRPLSQEQRDDMLATIHRQAGTLINLINELLDLARIEARRGKDFRPRPQPLQPIVRNALAGLMIRDDPREVVVDMRPTPVWVNVDADKLSLALTNVVSNAYKYSVSGDITLGMVERTLPPHSLPGQIEPVEQVGLRVADQGIGMTQEQLSRLFERFFRVDDSRRIPGTGLGTSIVKEVIEQHGGQVEVQSAPGEGTTFTLWLPVHRATTIGVAVRGLRAQQAATATEPAGSPAAG